MSELLALLCGLGFGFLAGYIIGYRRGYTAGLRIAFMYRGLLGMMTAIHNPYGDETPAQKRDLPS